MWGGYSDGCMTISSSASRSSFSFASPDTGASGGGGAFHSYPEKFPNTRRKAAQFVQHVHAITKKGPRTLVGKIVDTSFFHSQGYVTVTTELGVVSVYGVPYGSVVAGMRIFVRQMGGHATNQVFVYDGQAPNLSGLGMSSGSVAITTSLIGTGTTPTNANSLVSSSLAGSAGYYWHCFFYLPALPATSVTLWQMSDVTGTNTVSLDYLPSGRLYFWSPTNGSGYVSSQIVTPHQVHWFLSQPGISGMKLMIDGVSLSSVVGDITFTGTSHTYLIDLLSDHSGNNPCAPGTWISKIGWGTSVTGSTPVALSTSIPQSDSDLPSTGGTTTTKLLLLCGDSIGGSAITNSATAGSVPINTAYVTVLATGPY